MFYLKRLGKELNVEGSARRGARLPCSSLGYVPCNSRNDIALNVDIVHASLEGDIHWDDIDSFYDTTRWSFPGGATDPTVACKSWASLREYLDFLRANCGPEVLNRFHFNTRLPRLSEHLDENDPKTPSQSSFSEHATVEEDGNGFDEPEDAERSCDEMDVDIEDLFNNGTYIGHDRKSDTSSDDSEPEEPVNDAAEPEIVEPGVTEREYEEPKTGGRKRKHEPPIPEVKEYYEEPPKKAKRCISFCLAEHF